MTQSATPLLSNAAPKRLAGIVAMSRNEVIGVKDKLPWHIPSELEHFKKITLNHTLIVGSNTYKTLPYLQDRKLVVLSSKDLELHPNTVQVRTVEEALEVAGEDAIVIGGAAIYETFMPYITRWYLTFVGIDIADSEDNVYMPTPRPDFSGYSGDWTYESYAYVAATDTTPVYTTHTCTHNSYYGNSNA